MIVVAWPDRGSVMIQHVESGLAAVGTDMAAASSALALAMFAAQEKARPSVAARMRAACLAHRRGSGSRRVSVPLEQASLLYENWYAGPKLLRTSTARVPLPRYLATRDERGRWRVRMDDDTVQDLPEYIRNDLSRCYALDTVRTRALAAGNDNLPASARVDGRRTEVIGADGTIRSAKAYLRQAGREGLIRATRGERTST